MEDKGRRDPIAMKDMFPGTKAERVSQLLQEPDFRARQAIANLSIEIKRKQEAGEDVRALSELLSTAYTPAMQALGEKLTEAGWNNAEQSAAHMAAEGTIKLS